MNHGPESLTPIEGTPLVSRLEAKLDSMANQIGELKVAVAEMAVRAEAVAEIKQQLGEHSGRIGTLEGFRWMVLGIATGASTVTSAIVTIAIELYRHGH